MGLTDEVIMKGSEYEALCDKMRELTGKTDKFTSSQLLEELSNVKGKVVLEDLTVTENGIYVPGEGVDGYGSVTVNVEKGTSDVEAVYVTFMSYNGAKELHKRAVLPGNDCMDVWASGLIDADIKSSTNTEVFAQNGWALSANGEADANALKNVTEDRIVYAAFVASTRYYTVRFFDGDTLLKTMQCTYGGTADYTIEKDGYLFNGWTPSNTNITADTDCYAQWATALTFANATWEQIAEISEAGEAASYFAVGDEKSVPITYSDGTTASIVVQVAGFNHDDLSDGTGKAGISIVCKTIPVYKTMLGAASNTKNWAITYTNANNAVHNALKEQGDIWKMLPTELQAVLKAVNKKYNASGHQTGTNSALNTTAEKLWALSLDELGYTVATNTNYSTLGSKYDLYESVGSSGRFGWTYYTDGTQSIYWTRSAYRNTVESASGTYCMKGAPAGGGVMPSYVVSTYYYDTSYKYGIRFGFCV